MGMGNRIGDSGKGRGRVGKLNGEEKGMGKGKRREGRTMLLFPYQKTQFLSI